MCVSESLTAVFLFFFPLWFIVCKNTGRSYPPIHTKVCIWKSCSEKGKKKKLTETLRVRKWNSAVMSQSVRPGNRFLIFLWTCFLWDWWGGWCFWENGDTPVKCCVWCWQGECIRRERAFVDHFVSIITVKTSVRNPCGNNMQPYCYG